MIRFLLKGLLRDRSRSLFPILITASGVAITVLVFAWVGGILHDTVETAARFKTGHVKVRTRALNEQRYPNIMELVLTDAGTIQRKLQTDFPRMIWKSRIQFGGLLDIPDKNGETAAQAPVAGLGADLTSPDSPEIRNLNLKQALIKGALPRQPGEILLSDALFEKLALGLGQNVTYIGSDMNGSMVFHNFTIAGTVRFGIRVMDRGAIIADLADMRQALNMMDATTEIFGFFEDGFYHPEKAAAIKTAFNSAYLAATDIFTPVMVTLEDQDDLGEMLSYMNSIFSAILIIFIFVISIVLWNAGLMNGIRRYGEIGIRLAIGESKTSLYWSMIVEAVLLGVASYLLGTILGLIPAYYLQVHGVDFGYFMQNSSYMMNNIMRARISPINFWIGIVPGVVAPFIGAVISGLAIFKRETAQLFKELET
ncbi:FtsX-like permease family protein [bacterium]|nr:FtsX-like permease family protein [bacterium]